MNPEAALTFSGPAEYKISVQGKLDESLVESFGSMRISEERGRADTIITTISARIRDQAELSGIINALYEARLPILLVERIIDIPKESSSVNSA